jgi:hypothetical protein
LISYFAAGDMDSVAMGERFSITGKKLKTPYDPIYRFAPSYAARLVRELSKVANQRHK